MKESWRSDAAFICLFSLAPVVTYQLHVPNHLVGMMLEEPHWCDGSAPADVVPALDEPDLSSTGVSSLVVTHGIPAFDIWT